MTTHRVLQVGMGPLGRMLTPVLEAKASIDVVSALDINPELEGTDLSDLTGAANGVAVTSDVAQALGQSPDVAVVTTVSEIDRLEPQITPLIEAGVHVVSTCEELSYPWVTQPEISARIDRSAKAKNVTVLGTGINPGFLMDFLPSAVTAVCHRVDAVLVERIQDATTRRLPFRQKIGAGLTAKAFNERVESGKIRHVGLTESMHLVAEKLGWTLDRTEDVVEPVITDVAVSGEGWTVDPGNATGVNQVGHGFVGEDEVITLVFRAAIGQPDPRDTVTLKGDPDYVVNVPGGTHGDVATCAIVTNAVATAATAPRGLRTMADVPPLSCIP